MTGADVYYALNQVDETIVQQAQEVVMGKSVRGGRNVYQKHLWAAAALAFVLAAGGMVWRLSDGTKMPYVDTDRDNLVGNNHPQGGELSDDTSTENVKSLDVYEEGMDENAGIYVEGVFYQLDPGNIRESIGSDYKYIGVIDALVPADGQPNGKMQTNEGALVGSRVYRFGKELAVYSPEHAGYWMFAEAADLVYRLYDSGFDIACMPDSVAFIQWELPADVEEQIEAIYLYDMGRNTKRELTDEEYAQKEVSFTVSGHYALYGVDSGQRCIDLTNYVAIGTQLGGNQGW